MTLIWAINKQLNKFPPFDYGGLGIVVTNDPKEEVKTIEK